MKNISSLVLMFILGVLFSHCDKDDSLMTTCDSEGGVTITDQSGRIYKWTNSEPNYYYIGNVQPVTTGINGGYISCSELPLEFQNEGLLVVYSGIDKGPAFCDACDPLFWFMSLSSIKKSE